MVLAVNFKHFYVNDAIAVFFCVFFRPRSPDEVSKVLHYDSFHYLLW